MLRWYRTVTHIPAFRATPTVAAGDGHGQTQKHPPKKKKSQKPEKKGAAERSRGLPSGAAGSTGDGMPDAKGGGGAPGGEPLPVVGACGDLLSSDAIVQGGRRLGLAPAKFRRRRVRVRELLESGTASVGKKALVKGWLRTARSASKGALMFLVVDDGSCSETIQVCVWRVLPPVKVCTHAPCIFLPRCFFLFPIHEKLMHGFFFFVKEYS